MLSHSAREIVAMLFQYPGSLALVLSVLRSFHLFRYLDEQSFRFNYRGSKENPITDSDRLNIAASQLAGKRITFAQLTGKVGQTVN